MFLNKYSCPVAGVDLTLQDSNRYVLLNVDDFSQASPLLLRGEAFFRVLSSLAGIALAGMSLAQVSLAGVSCAGVSLLRSRSSVTLLRSRFFSHASSVTLLRSCFFGHASSGHGSSGRGSVVW